MSEGPEIIRQAPKKTNTGYRGWNDLNSELEIRFHQNKNNKNAHTTIMLSSYSIDEKEIKKALREKGYETKDITDRNGEKHLKITIKD